MSQMRAESKQESEEFFNWFQEHHDFRVEAKLIPKKSEAAFHKRNTFNTHTQDANNSLS